MKRIILAILVMLTLTLSACGGSTEGPGVTQTYLGGTQGLEISFAPGAPPEKVQDFGGDQEFDIVINIENKGEHKVAKEDAVVTIKGFRPADFNLAADSTNPEEDLEARRKNPDGSVVEPPRVQALFESLRYQYVEPGNQLFDPIVAEICYGYETNVASTLCVKEDMTSTDPDDVCQVSGTRPVTSSGAPVQVTKIQQAPSGNSKTSFTFTVANMAKGNVYKLDAACEKEAKYENKVWVTIQNLENRGASDVKCTGLREKPAGEDAIGYVDLPQGASTEVYCTVEFDDLNDRVQPFNIKLEYDYNQRTETSLLVEYTPED